MTFLDDHFEPPNLSPEKLGVWTRYYELREQGHQPDEAGSLTRISSATQAHWEAWLRHLALGEAAEARAARVADEDSLPTPYDDLCPQAQRALEDFDYFRHRYFGRRATPWQRKAADALVEYMATPYKEFVVVNCPPGAGKSTLFAHDIPLWLLIRNRALRCMIGSRTERQASTYVARMRRTLMQRIKVDGAEATMMHDFGSFRPVTRDLWRMNEFVVAQPDEVEYGEKEPTFSAFGYDSAFLGGRYDLVVWDDLVDRHVLATAEARETMQRWFGDEAETRVEPGGLFVLQGQRLDADDLYRYALNIRLEDGTPKYKHIKFPAHDDSKCENQHGMDSPFWPGGCLLDPVRVPWRDLATKKIQSFGRYATVYQQEDVDYAKSLVQPIWLDGGTEAGIVYRGCWDNRSLGQYPSIDTSACVAIVGVDPSPTKDWGITHWLYDRSTERRYLMDIFVGPMAANGLLDFDHLTSRYSGLLHDWVRKSYRSGFPIQAVVVEINAAQRFLMQLSYVQRWSAQYRIDMVPHQTNIRKRDPSFGPQILSGLYRDGLIRLPGRSRDKVEPLTTDVLRWHPDTTFTCDAMHSQWFVEANLEALAAPRNAGYAKWTPSWMNGQRGFVLNNG